MIIKNQSIYIYIYISRDLKLESMKSCNVAHSLKLSLFIIIIFFLGEVIFI